jgi:hypothetical protein
VLDWADGLLATHADRQAIVVTHNLLSGDSFTTQGLAVYNALSDRPNLFLMLGGHQDTEGRRDETRTGMQTVYALRSDYQSQLSQQSGWLRVHRFSPEDDHIHVKTYSPTRYSYRSETSSSFSLAYEMYPMDSHCPAFAEIGTTVVASGSQASVNWEGLTTGEKYQWYVTMADSPRTTTSPVWSFTAGSPTAVDLRSFTATQDEAGISLKWETATEVVTLGFHLYRDIDPRGVGTRLNEALIPCKMLGSPVGAEYAFLDDNVESGVGYYYWLEIVDVYGKTTRHGPVRGSLWEPNTSVYLPLVRK